MLHSALTLCISMQQRKAAHGEGNFGTSTYARHSVSVSLSLCLLELLCLGGNPLRTRKNALWLLHKEKPLQHFPYKHTYSIYSYDKQLLLLSRLAYFHIMFTALPLFPSLFLCLWQHDNNLSHFNHLAHQSCHTHISAAAALKEANEPLLQLSYAKFL